jgi:WD40 repeat protein
LEPRTGRRVSTFGEHVNPVSSILAFPKGERVLSVSKADGFFCIWNALSGKVLSIFRVPESSGEGVLVSPDESKMACKADACTLVVWSLAERKELFRGRQEGWIPSAAFSNDGDLVASAEGGGAVYVRNAETGAEVARLKHETTVNGMAFTPGDRTLFCRTSDAAQEWDWREGRCVRTVPGLSKLAWILDHPERFRFAVQCGEEETVVTDAFTGRLLAALPERFDKATLALGPCGRTWLAVRDGCLHLYRVDGSK